MDKAELTDTFRQELAEWARSAEESGQHYLSKGYQGRVLLYKSNGHRLVLKAPTPWWPYSVLSKLMLHHEARVYQKLTGLNGIPRCHGMVGNRYLVLDYIEGDCLREVELRNPDVFFESFLRTIRLMHAAGVGHADLKRKDNILVGSDEKPWLIDFGVAVTRKRGFRPLNRFLFNTARRFDLNAWVKHKYRRRLGDASPSDQRYLHLTWMERTGRRLKRLYRRLRPKRN